MKNTRHEKFVSAMRRMAKGARHKLTPRENLIIRWALGTACPAPWDHRLIDLARRLNVSKERVVQIEMAILHKTRAALVSARAKRRASERAASVAIEAQSKQWESEGQYWMESRERKSLLAHMERQNLKNAKRLAAFRAKRGDLPRAAASREA